MVSGPGEGERLGREDRTILVKVVRPELDVLEFDVGPDYDGPGPHYHERHTDSWYVLEGELELTIAGETVRLGAGGFVSVPPGVVHSFTNGGSGRARFLNIHSPDQGFTDYLRARTRGEDVDPAAFDIHNIDA
jgi:mannose-6-phosphate isomerase-like protein (cupin superfamily)